MGRGGYKVFYGTIGLALTEIAKVLEQHDYALVPEKIYQTWVSFGTFKSEESAAIRKRDRFIAHFVDEDGQKWSVVTYKCAHEHLPLRGAHWRFVERIKRGHKVFARSNITIAAYERIVRKAQKKAEEEEEYFGSFVARWFSD